MKTEIRKAIAATLVLTVTSSAVTPAWAETIGTESALVSDRERILVVLDRADVRSVLEARGVSTEDAKARIETLTDAEAAQLAQQIDSAPAGARDLRVLLLPIYLVVGAVYLVALLISGVVTLASKASSQDEHASKPTKRQKAAVKRQAATPMAQADFQ